MKRRRVFQVVVEYDTEHDREGHPYPWWPNPERTNPPINPDDQIDAETILDRIVDVPCNGWEWFADVQVTEEGSDVRRLIADLVDPDPCSFDHHGGCQAHGYLSLEPGEVCPQAEAKQWLADHPGEG